MPYRGLCVMMCAPLEIVCPGIVLRQEEISGAETGWNRVISNFVHWQFRYIGLYIIYCLVIGMFNGQFSFSENLMYGEKNCENYFCR